jgi:hypothetical protein
VLPLPFTNDNIIYESLSDKVIPPIQKHVCNQIIIIFYETSTVYKHKKMGLAVTFRGFRYVLRAKTEY